MREGPPRIGRFIKRTNKRLMDCVTVAKFDFAQVCDEKTASPDNPGNNIIHVRLHEKTELAKFVLDPGKFNSSLVDRNNKRPVLRPLSFDDDWRRQLDRRNRRSQRGGNEDDDLIDIEIEEQLREAFGGSTGSNDPAKSPPAAEGSEPSEGSAGPAEASSQEAPAEGSNLTSFQRDLQTIDAVGKVIREIATHPSPTDGSQDHDPGRFSPVHLEAPKTDDDSTAPHSASAGGSGEAGDAGEGAEVALESDVAAGDGDEERSEAKGGQASNQDLQKLMSQLTHLKRDVLLAAEKNYVEIAQAVAEALLRKELSMDPSKLGNLIQAAVERSIKDDEFKIHVHPKTAQALQASEQGPWLEHLIVDEGVTEGEFRVESKHSVMDGSLKDVVRDMIDSLDLKLVQGDDEHEKAG